MKPITTIPQGYHEWEEVKQVSRKPDLFDIPCLEGKAIKVVSPLLSQLPYQHDYKVIFMNRSVEEVAASQKIMIDRRQSEGSTLTVEQLQAELVAHRSSAVQWLECHPRARVLEVDLVDLLENPDRWIPQIIDFVGADKLPEASRMGRPIDRTLRRNRKSD